VNVDDLEDEIYDDDGDYDDDYEEYDEFKEEDSDDQEGATQPLMPQYTGWLVIHEHEN
jgi:hypothetical protein